MLNRKERQALHTELLNILLKNAETDEDFFNRLLYALEVISNELNRFGEEN